MDLYIKNLLNIKDANINIKGLTIIVGENDTGKSTIGKALFCLIDLLNLNLYKARIKYVLRLLYDLENIIKYEKNFTGFKTMVILKEINKLKVILKYKRNFLFENKTKTKYLESIEKIEKYIPKKFKDENKVLLTILDNLKNVFDEKFLEKIKKDYAYQTLNNLFFGDFIKKGENEAFLKLSLKDEFILVKVNKDGTLELKEKNLRVLKNLEISYIETPFIFNIMNILLDTSLEGKEYYPILKDLKEKLISLPKKDKFLERKNLEEIKQKIIKIIGGKIEIDDLTGRFLYKKGSNSYQIENTATGIKAFGILLILLEKGYIGKNSILFLDEPEVHLHPKWQIEYGKIIVELVKFGVNVIISTHSPYMVDILEVLTKKEKINSNFYFAFNENNENKFRKLSVYNLEEIYSSLAKPIDIIREEENKIEDYKNN